MDPRQRIKELTAQIRLHLKKYHGDDAPEISDEQFDSLMRELRGLEEKHPEFATKDSPTQKVGGEPSKKFEPYSHNPPMQSLDNAFNDEELYKFNKRVLKDLYPDIDKKAENKGARREIVPKGSIKERGSGTQGGDEALQNRPQRG